jgi:hypothetical protein
VYKYYLRTTWSRSLSLDFDNKEVDQEIQGFRGAQDNSVPLLFEAL